MASSFQTHNFLQTFQSQTNKNISHKLVQRLSSEYSSFPNVLPLNYESSILSRVDENNIQLLKFLVIPCDDTPYASGCFIFDCFIPNDYPTVPPKVNLMTTGKGTVRFNPNLYDTGYVCLSLLGTWSGHTACERWQPNISTLLQVLISVQSLIFVNNPYFNEPGYEQRMNNDADKKASLEYSKNIQINTVKWAMIDCLKNPCPEFKDAIFKHFLLQKNRILKNAKLWLGNDHQSVKELEQLIEKIKE